MHKSLSIEQSDMFKMENLETSFKAGLGDIHLHQANDNDNRYWYLATPYTLYEGGHEKAYHDAAKMLAFLEDNGLFMFCPITHFHTASEYTKSIARTDTDAWNVKCLKFLALSRGVIVTTMEGWDKSRGIAKEVKKALDLKLPVVYTEFLTIPNV